LLHRISLRRILASPYTTPAALLVLVLLFFFITVVVAVSTNSNTVEELVRLQNKVVETNVDLVNIGRAQVCITGVNIDDRSAGTTNWCLVENLQPPLYPDISPTPPTGGS